MSLDPGTHLGPYEIVAPLGEGGMGEVYRARDTKLNRDVAIKVLPDAFATDAERLARFTREAQTLAALNHPNIAQIYGVEDNAIVMELVEGEDLSERISQGRMSIDDALPIARQIIDALEAAHEIGIVHRDLKPANIKVRDDGTVKVLDFGLAKALDSGGSSATPDTANSPTLTARATLMGMIIGTAAYMSPEQARGRAVDRRTDVWAFGCVLYEMLTGAKAFDGEDATEIISSVVKSEPDWNALPASVPAHVRTVVTQCLVKDRKARIPDLAVVRYMLDGTIPTEGPSEAAAAMLPPQRSAKIWQAATVAFVLTTLVAGAAWYRAQAVVPEVTRFFVTAPEGAEFVAGNRRAAGAVISPDGRTLAFTAADETGTRMLWLRPVDSLTAQQVPGTEGAANPFWSPDSVFIGYSIFQKLMKIRASGGPARPLCDLLPGMTSRGGAWSPDGVIILNNGPTTLYRVSEAGGEATPVGQLAAGQVGQEFPSFLPDGRHFLYHSNGTEESEGVNVGSLDTDESTHVVQSSSGAIYDPSSRRLLFVLGGTLVAQEFDLNTFELVGDAVRIAEDVESSAAPGLVAFSISDTGALAYGIGAATTPLDQMVWVDRQGQVLETVGEPAENRGVELSPNEALLATHHETDEGGDIWLTNLQRDTTQRFTIDPTQHNASPVWSPDGTRIAYSSVREGKAGVYVQRSDNTGDEQLLFERDAAAVGMGPVPFAWTPEEDFVLFGMSVEGGRRDLFLLPTSGERTPEPLVHTPFNERLGQISFDGKWLAYSSNENGGGRGSDIYVQAVSADSRKWLISSGASNLPRWSADGRELFYQSGGNMYAVDIGSNGAELDPGTPRLLFDMRAAGLGGGGSHSDYFNYAVSEDGRFLMPQRAGGAADAARPIVVVLNWADAIGR